MTVQNQNPQTEKSSVFKVRDIFPPYNKEKDKSKGVIDWEQMAPRHNQPEPLEKANDIPKFDLGMEVLARQRQAASQKRQGPGQKKFQLHAPNLPSKALNEEAPKQKNDGPTIYRPPVITPTETAKPQVPEFLKEQAEPQHPPQPQPQPKKQQEPKFDAELIAKPALHIADRLMPIMNQTEEQIIFNIVESDIKRFLQQ